jgi:hypothetical protein
VSIDGLLVAIDIVTGAAAGLANVIGSTFVSPGATRNPAGKTIWLLFVTCMVAVAAVSPAAVAVNVVEPTDTAVTGTGAEDAPCGTMTGVGTVATPPLLELSVTATPPAPAGEGRVTVTFCIEPAGTEMDPGASDNAPGAITCTVWDAPV